MWISKTNAIGIVAKAGRYGGTYAHKDIAFEFASWISPKFKLFLIKEFQRLKNDEIEKQKLGWDIKRTIVKMNYHIYTDAIKSNLIPPNVAKNRITFKKVNSQYLDPQYLIEQVVSMLCNFLSTILKSSTSVSLGGKVLTL